MAPEAPPPEPDPKLEALSNAKVTKEQAVARKAVIEADKAAGALVLRREAVETMVAICRVVTVRLQAFPARLSSQLAPISQVEEIHKVLEAEVRLILEEFQEQAEDFAGDDDGSVKA